MNVSIFKNFNKNILNTSLTQNHAGWGMAKRRASSCVNLKSLANSQRGLPLHKKIAIKILRLIYSRNFFMHYSAHNVLGFSESGSKLSFCLDLFGSFCGNDKKNIIKSAITNAHLLLTIQIINLNRKFHECIHI